MSPQLSRAGEWFLRSGIQESNGGVARYYRADLERNQPISTEITAYSVSALLYLYRQSCDQRYLDRALAAARFLTGHAWDHDAQVMPFEIAPSEFTYFFDCGIVIRGLLAAWKASGVEEFLAVAAALGKSMAQDFVATEQGGYHPILSLPDKQPLPRDPLRWSRSSECYQLKSAMAWWNLYEATGESSFRQFYDQALAHFLPTWSDFLPGHPEEAKVMDRLHAFLYFLEGLLPRAREPQCEAALCSGIRYAAGNLHQVNSVFKRSDVYAQLLRIRLHAFWAGVEDLDLPAAQSEATMLEQFQMTSDDPRIDGAFNFAFQGAVLSPYINPVSTAFSLQAVDLWRIYQEGGKRPDLDLLV